jgi:hypothetical protein
VNVTIPADAMFIRRTSRAAQVQAMRSLVALLVCLTPVMVSAETIRLTPEQADAAIEAGAARRALPDGGLSDSSPSDRAVHGEVGVAVGTGGYRSFYGVAGMPLGDSGSLVLGYGQERGRALGWRGDPCRGTPSYFCNAQINGAFSTPNR